MWTWLALLTIPWLTTPATAPVLDMQRAELPTLEELLERYVEAVGGRQAVQQLTTRALEGLLVTDLPSRQPPIHESNAFAIYAKVPGKFMYVQRSTRGEHRDVCNGVTCWTRAGDEIRLNAHYDPRFAWLVDPQNALRVRDYFPRMRVTGSRTLDGRQAFRVDIDDDESHALYFDAETGLLVRLGYNRELSDYREVNGVMVPFRMAISRKGGSSTYVFETIEHNVPVDDAQFDPPVRAPERGTSWFATYPVRTR